MTYLMYLTKHPIKGKILTPTSTFLGDVSVRELSPDPYPYGSRSRKLEAKRFLENTRCGD